MKIPAGAIPQRVPRALTRDEAGGDATDEDFARLAESFAKPQRRKERTERKSKDSNGWGA